MFGRTGRPSIHPSNISEHGLCAGIGDSKTHQSQGAPQQMWPLICLHAWPTFPPLGGEREASRNFTFSWSLHLSSLYPYPFLLLFSPSDSFPAFRCSIPLSPWTWPNSRCLVSGLRLTDWQVYFLWALSSAHMCVRLHMRVYAWTRVRVHVASWGKTVSLVGQEYREIHFHK